MHRIKLGYKSVEHAHYAHYRIVSTAEYHYGLKADPCRHGLHHAMQHALDIARRQPDAPLGLALVGAGSRYPRLHGVPSSRLSLLFWESLFEKVRSDDFPEQLSRLESFFATPALEDAAIFKREHGIGELLCKVDLSGCTTQAQLDYALLGAIDGGWDYARAWQQIGDYWAGKVSHSPIMEVLCQGEVVFAERCLRETDTLR